MPSNLSPVSNEREPTQETQPKGKGAKPVEIPVPERSAFDKVVKKAAAPGGARPKPRRDTAN